MYNTSTSFWKNSKCYDARASYYSKNADLKELFDRLEISKGSSYKEHLNKHNVIYMTFNQIPNANCTYEDFIGRYTSFLLKDLK